MLTVLSNLAQCYMYLGALRRFGNYRERFGPAFCISAALVLLMVHPSVYLLKDLRLINPVCQSKWGMFAIYFSTYGGFANLIYGAMWATDGFRVLRSAANRKIYCGCVGR